MEFSNAHLLCILLLQLQLLALWHAVNSCGTMSSILYLSSTQANNKICNKCIFSFAATMTDHHTPTTALSTFTPKHESQGLKLLKLTLQLYQGNSLLTQSSIVATYTAWLPWHRPFEQTTYKRSFHMQLKKYDQTTACRRK